MDIILSCEQVVVLPGWLHIRLCGCDANEDDVVAAAASAAVVKIRTTTTITAARSLTIVALFTYHQTIYLYI